MRKVSEIIKLNMLMHGELRMDRAQADLLLQWVETVEKRDDEIERIEALKREKTKLDETCE